MYSHFRSKENFLLLITYATYKAELLYKAQIDTSRQDTKSNISF